ncbi:uncharacterized protein LOC110033383 [Phalaenopsis equestris]|uniref:uncharacterized protein LOC110033383 n=1 Tax=Phalaenopsis equestris TaxID=78828 RepID=UPI0009E495F3|nr:uncharacterized protein LOC110033383 [Phalaenopsis equestris]
MSEKEKRKLLWPPWLSPLLHTSFFSPCDFHSGLSRNECNMYCIDCANGALCSSCLVQHYNHRIIQIRRSSYHDVIRVAEIQSLVDISGIQTYVINGAKVVFLNERLQPKMGKTAATNTCRNCRRSLLYAFGFCSLGCKLFKTTSSPSSISKPLKPHSVPKKAAINEESKFIFSNISFDCISPTAHETPSIKMNRIKRRKGIPRRAPMGVYS